MLLLMKKLIRHQIHLNQVLHRRFSTVPPGLSESSREIDRIIKSINDHPFPFQPLELMFQEQIPPEALSTVFVEKVLDRLFAGHSNGLKALEFFRYSSHHLQGFASSGAFEKTLHILTRMRYFDKAWGLMEEIRVKDPSLLTMKSMSIVLSKIAKFQSYEDTLQAFDRMEKEVFVGRKFGTEEFNVLLRAFCTQRLMKEARSVFNKMHSRFSPDIKSANILLVGFRESGDVSAVELFYHEMLKRGFKPNAMTYNIRIDVYCKKGSFGDALRLREEMERANFMTTVETLTTLIHGAGIARNPTKARQLFDEILSKNLCPDTGAYNALIGVMVRCRDIKAALALYREMEEKQIGHDNVTYHTLFLGLMRSQGVVGVSELYIKMIEKEFVPRTETVVRLMKFFCVNLRIDLGLHLWEYIIQKAHCPHSHALDILLTALCSRGRLQEAFECSKQIMERGRHMNESTFRMLAGLLMRAGETDKLRILTEMIRILEGILPPSKGHARSGIVNF